MDKNNLKLKYQGYTIVLQEVPDEIALAFNISGCPHRCLDCHSKYLWDYEGNYLGEDLENVLSKYKDYISCVCFMGGDQNIEELAMLCKHIKSYNLKVCIYSGSDDISLFNDMINDNSIDYLKLGPYKKEYGGLDSTITNQVMYHIVDQHLINITDKFQKPKM